MDQVRRWLPPVSLSLALVGATLAGVAATPTAEAPDPGPCNGLHRNVAGMAAVFATPAANAAMPAAEPAGTPGADHHATQPAPPAATDPAPEPQGTPRLLQPELPAGEPVAAEVERGLTTTMLRYRACANAGDAIGLISLVSDDYLRLSFGAATMTEADLRAYADSTAPLPLAQRRRLVALREAREVAPETYVALVDSAPIGNEQAAAIDTDLVTFVPDGFGNYLIDQYVAGVTVWFGPLASPAP